MYEESSKMSGCRRNFPVSTLAYKIFVILYTYLATLQHEWMILLPTTDNGYWLYILTLKPLPTLNMYIVAILTGWQDHHCHRWCSTPSSCQLSPTLLTQRHSWHPSLLSPTWVSSPVGSILAYHLCIPSPHLSLLPTLILNAYACCHSWVSTLIYPCFLYVLTAYVHTTEVDAYLQRFRKLWLHLNDLVFLLLHPLLSCFPCCVYQCL